MNLEKKILKHLLKDDNYIRKTLPFIKEEYFQDNTDKIVFKTISEYVLKYNLPPTQETLKIELENISTLSEEQFKKTLQLVDDIASSEASDKDTEWLIENTEKFCQEKAVYNAIMKSINILDGAEKNLDKGSIPSVLSDALAVSFDNHVGHDFISDAESRYEFYHKVERRIPFDLDYMNRITKDGLPNKTLNIILAGTGVGKSLAMCHFAAANLSLGKNVLYVTLEMSEERIAERIDANLMNVSLDVLAKLPKEDYMRKIERIKTKTKGKLIVKEYPTASAHVGHFKHLLNELKLKKQFVPDIIYVDYLNICSSSRIKANAGANSYTLVKSIAEELRGLAVEFDLPIVSATQTTRSGYENSDVSLTDTSESFGLPATADFMIALIATEELSDLNQVMVKQLKNRYASPDTNKRFVLGIDRSKMKLFDAEQSAQSDIIDSGQDVPVFDNSSFGKRSPRRDFSNLKVS